MTTTEINYDQVFQLFKGDDELRPNFNHPFKQRGKYYATDAHSLICLPIEDAELNYPEQDSPNATAVVPTERTMNIEINISELEAKLIPVLIDEEIEESIEKECRDCDGDGSHECDCGDVHDCQNCGGSGKVTDEKLKKTGKQIPNINANYKMHGVFYKYKQLRRLIDACKLLGVETITKVFGGATKASLFICGKPTILVMPVVNSGYEANTDMLEVMEHTLIF